MAGWVSTLTIAVFGGTYLWRCSQFLMSPGVPVRLDYEAVGGKGLLEAESFSVDPWKQGAKLNSASLREPGGTLVAKATTVDARWDGRGFHIETQGLSAQVVRGADGRFNFSTALPKPAKAGPSPSVELHAKRAEVRYVDLSATPGLARNVILDDVSLLQESGDLVANSLLTVDSVSRVKVQTQLSPDGDYWLRVAEVDSDLTSLWPVTQRYVDLKPLGDWGVVDPGRVRASGWLEISGGAGPDVDVRGDLTMKSPSVLYGKNGFSGALDAHLSGSTRRANIDVSLVDRGRSLAFVGTAAFAKGADFRGSFKLNSSDGRLWPPLERAIPKGVRFRAGKSQGTLSYVGGVLAMVGNANVGSASYSGESVKNVQTKFAFSKNVLTLDVGKSLWRGGPVAGTIQADIGRGTLLGIVNLKDRSLHEVLSPLGVDTVTGTGSARALIKGTMSSPSVDLLAQGTANVRMPDDSVFRAGTFEARATVNAKGAKVQRLVVSGPNGVLAAKGTYDFKSKAVKGDVMAGAVPLSVFSSDASGTGFLRGKITGTVSKPIYNARFEAYGAKWKDKGVAQVIGQLHGDKDSVDFDRLSLLSGTGSADGVGHVNLKSKAVTGTFQAQNLSLSEYLGEDVLGSVTITDGTIAGTIEKPVVSANVKGQKVTAFGMPFDSFDASVLLRDDVVSLVDAKASLHGSLIQASAEYGLKDQRGHVKGSITDLSLSDVLISTEEINVAGKANGAFELSGVKDDWNGKGSIDLINILVNGSPLGSGTLALKADDGIIHVQGDVGSVDRYLSLTDLALDPKNRSFTADVAAYNLRLNDMILATRPYWQNSWPDRPDWLAEADGGFTGVALIKADPESWSLGPSDLILDNLRIAGRDAGKFTAKVSREGSRWLIPNVSWKSADSTLDGQGWVDDDGHLDIQASLTDLDLSWIKALFPDTPLVTGKATATIVASGMKDDPTGRASLLVDRAIVTYRDGQKASDPIQLLLDDLSFGNKQLSVGGHATYSGFTGAISALVPYSSLNPDPEAHRDALTASLKFDDRPISDFKEQISDIDYDKSDGQVRLAATVTGFIDDLKVAANAGFESSRLVLKSMDTELHDVRLNFNQNGRKANVHLEAMSGKGGKIGANLTANLAHVFGSDFDVDALLDDSTLSGDMTADAFLLAQKMPGAKDPTTGKVDGRLTIGGSLRNPVVSGDVGLDRLVVWLPQEVAPGTATSMPIDPTFSSVKVRVGSGTRIETGVGPLIVRGDGVIAGSLSDPAVNVPLTLESGTFRLPSGRLSLEPGGQIVISYNSLGGGEPVARVDLDLEGHTTVIARSSTGQYEPFRIVLGIQGNVMDEKNMRLTAVSDPPDLSQDEILALVGQRDLIQGLAAGVLGGSGESSKLRDALYSFAIPSFSQNLTQGIASGLKLDYLTVDYNPFDQVIMSAGKTIGKGLVLQVTRQLQGTEVGPLRYEVKLVYRLPVADRFFSRVTLGLGFDQSVPIKLTLNWSKRF